MPIFENIKKRLSSDFLRNSTILLSANTLSQLIALVVYPIITRQYNPDELGVLSLFLSISGIGIILASGKYESAIMIEKREKDSAAAFDITFLINIVVCSFFFVILFLFKPWIIETFNLGSVSTFILYIPVFIFFSSLGNVLTYWFNRNNKFKLTAGYNIIQSVFNSSLKVILGAFKWTKWGLIMASIWGQIVAVIFAVCRKKNINSLFKFEKNRMRKVAVRQIDFPKYTLPHAFINTLSSSLPIIILAAYFNMAEVGLFSLAITMGLKPIHVFTNSMNQVFFQRVSNNRMKNINSHFLLKKFWKHIVGGFLPLFIVLYFSMPYLVRFLFGENWLNSAVYLQLMLPWFFIILMTSSLSFIPAVVGKQFKAMILEIIYTVIRLILLFIGVWYKDIKLAIFLFSMGNTLYLIGLLIWYLSLIKNEKA